jgi:pentatricopeptide repeat protein
MTAAPSYGNSHSSVSDERQRRVKEKAALQALRETVAHHDGTALSQQGETDVELMYDGVHYLEHLISSRQESELQQISGASTDVDVLHGILKVWCHERRNAGHSPIAAIEPRIMLEWIDQLASFATDAQSSGGLMIAPSRETYRHLMDADPTNVELVETLFERMQRSEDPGLTPAVDDFHRVMHANLHNRRLQKAEAYLQALLQLHRSSQQDCNCLGLYQPSPRTYNLIIAGYAKAERPQDANRILQQMLDDGFVTNSSADPPPAYCFETCLNAWVASRHKSAGHRAETLLLQMQRLGLRPAERSLVKVIAAWTQSKRSSGPQRAEAILRLLLSMAEEDNDSAGRTANRSKVVLEAYLDVVRAFALTASRDPTAPDHCQRLMKELLSSELVDLAPSKSGRELSSTGTLLRKLSALVCLAWARSKRRDSVQHIEQLFHQLEADFALPLDRFCRNALLEAHAGAGDGSGALRTWRRFFERSEHDSASVPDVQSVNSVLLALHRSREASSKMAAEDFWNCVRSMPSVKPNVVTFNVLLSLTGRSDQVETARRGEAYLAELVTLYRKGDSACRPNLVSYSKAIELWVNVKSHPAEAIQCVQAHWASMQRQRMKPSDATRKAFSGIQRRLG